MIHNLFSHMEEESNSDLGYIEPVGFEDTFDFEEDAIAVRRMLRPHSSSHSTGISSPHLYIPTQASPQRVTAPMALPLSHIHHGRNISSTPHRHLPAIDEESGEAIDLILPMLLMQQIFE